MQARSDALVLAWHPDAAERSLERWLQVRGQEGWGEVPRDLDSLCRVFGASWYFTRFLFYGGSAAAAIIDDPAPVAVSGPELRARLRPGDWDARDTEAALDTLRRGRNEFMLSALVHWLRGNLPAPELEAALTCLAEQVLALTLEICDLTPDRLGAPFAVLGMGRLAAGEMTFGSDLDLIFLLPGAGGEESAEGGRRARRFLRYIAAAAPQGALYEVDMRLRPHGTAGALITSVDSFVEHHGGARETWERQMMTRCRPVYDPAGLGARALAAVLPGLYARRDAAALGRDIHDMRLRVERELGRRRGRHELKRGRGGLMDVDFACHYLQLLHGHADPALRVCATRAVLSRAEALGLLGADAAADLRAGYEFLRRLETCLRLFDLKNVSSVPMAPEECIPLARAMGFGADAPAFMAALEGHFAAVRARFEALLGG